MAIRIVAVSAGSPAELAGITAGEWIVSINGEMILDEIDYQALTVASRLEIDLRDDTGQTRSVSVRKGAWDPLGLRLDETESMKPRPCRNHCAFCFIDQMPPGMRETLYVKDDDWRLSMMMGNYVTLTNVSDDEFLRILKRKASPLYISVHATTPEVRIQLMKNPQAGRLMERLTDLKNHGLDFHAQVVLCPGINDGPILDRTIRDLRGLYPAARTLAIVPVGVTKHRCGLAKLKLFDGPAAAALIDQVAAYQEQYLDEIGTRFVFPSDEFYCLSGRPLPPEEAYEDYPQIENGVGLLRQLEEECALTAEELPRPERRDREILIPTGVSAHPFIQRLANQYAPEGTRVRVKPVRNTFFGETITVTGLIVGQDLIAAVRGEPCDEVLISASMLRENSDCFLDDLSFDEVRQAIGKPLRVVENTGESFLRALYGMEELT